MADENDDVSIDPDEDLDDSVVAEEHQGEAIKKLREKLKGAEEKARDYLDSWQRAQADFTNMRKRDEEARKQVVRYAGEKVISDLIPVLDALSLAASGGDKGIESIMNLLLKVLKQHGLVEIDELGVPFDPHVHESVGAVKVENKEDDHKVLEIMQKGYKLHEKVIRPARVKVSEYAKK